MPELAVFLIYDAFSQGCNCPAVKRQALWRLSDLEDSLNEGGFPLRGKEIHVRVQDLGPFLNGRVASLPLNDSEDKLVANSRGIRTWRMKAF